MKIKTQALKTALNNVRPAIRGRATLPILACVKLKTQKGKLCISATNLDEYFIEFIEADGEMEPICVSYEYIYLALSGESCELKLDKNWLTIICQNAETKIATMDADEFVAPPKLDKPTTHGLACSELAESIKSVAWASSTDESRYILKSVLIESTAKKLSVLATNGRELAIHKSELIGSDCSILAPSAFISGFCSALVRKGAILSDNENQIHVTHDEGEYFCKKLEGNYPNYKQVIPTDQKPLGSVAVAEFLGVVSSCVGFRDESEARGIFTFSKTNMLIEFIGDNGTALTRKLDGKFEKLVIGLSTKKLVRIFSNLKTEEAKLFFNDEFSPIVIEAGDLQVTTMPMRMS
jgi:DNA polymerase III subunit beta